jgi:FMN phosphatase YigB (HAD superfamily)
MGPSVLVFDLGNVLWHVDFEGWLPYLRTYNPAISEPDYRRFLEKAFSEVDRRNVSDEEYLDTYRDFLQKRDLTVGEAYRIHVWLLEGGPTKSMGIMPSLGSRYRLFIISNINPWHKRYVEETCDILSGSFERKIYSCDVGLKKPSPAIFELFRNLTRVNFADAIFFDDAEANVDAAKKLGLASCLVQSEDELFSYLTNEMLG